MKRIFISHSHSDVEIADSLFDFLIYALKIEEQDILCTSDPESGLTFGSDTISNQLKENLKNAEALIVLITPDSLNSAWIPFEVGSFWPTDKPIIIFLGSDLTPEKLPGPLKGWLSIRMVDEQVSEQINAAINQLARKLNIEQNPYNRRLQRKMDDFISCFRDWKSKRSNPDAQYQKQIKELTEKIQKNETLYQEKLSDIENNYQTKKQESEQKEYSLQQLQQTKNNELEQLEQNYKHQKEQLEQSLNTQINRLQQQLNEKELIIYQLQQQIDNLSTHSIKIELKSEKEVDYTKLCGLLAAGKWKEADQETDNVMLQATNRVSERWLRESDIDNFPCDDLHTINQLWVHYSKGKFGFSVQKKIYMDELGGTRYYNEKIWHEFCDRVGWRKGGDYVSYSDLTFELRDTTLVGHLPSPSGGLILLSLRLHLFSRFSHKDL
ncbi:GUN4 domain-containing protein [Crocosphaera sp.]|uniref:GUN4 domain-containing protein n=1 Tax=Crocosphaera sp. TaxID=2729996 RepID=UPI002630ADAE|nr:GUN4 domain-containing protein [Crocosphaera sp.]MDJ0582412.1 GUN4 domain-containing protein [Crocosphaera sp.]